MFEGKKKDKVLYKYVCEVCNTEWYMKEDFRENKKVVVVCPLECKGEVIYKGKRVLRKDGE